MKSLFLLALSLIAMSVFVFGGDAKQYPLTLTALSTYTRTSRYTANQPVHTDCTSDDFGHTNCSSTDGTKQGTEVHLVQNAEGSDGNTYMIEWTSGRQAFFAGGVAASSGGSVTYGATLMPGEYKARFDKHGLKLLIANEKGQLKEHSFTVLSVRKKDSDTSRNKEN